MLKRNRLHITLSALLLFSAAAPVFGQNTSATLDGVVVDSSGHPVAGATVEIIHEPSGTRSTVVTDSQGRYTNRGLRVGGPYTVQVQTGSTGRVGPDEVYLLLAETSTINLTLPPEAASLAAARNWPTP